MRKIDHLLLKINERRRIKPREGWNYSDRNHYAGWAMGGKYGCRKCNFITKNNHYKCPRYGNKEIIYIGYVARPPRKGASKKMGYILE